MTATATPRKFIVSKAITQRDCFHDHFDSWPCIVTETMWSVEAEDTGESFDYHERRKDAVAQVVRMGGVVSRFEV
jgi:hypothetical protein